LTATVRTVPTPDGRSLRVHDAGPTDGAPVFGLHGTPGSGLLFPPLADDAKRRGLRLLGYDRPGYGRSTPLPDRSVAQAATDVGTIADALGIDRFAVWGFSGGGPHALACAARWSGRAVGVAVVGGCAPYPADGLDWLAGMGPENVDEFDLTVAAGPPLERSLQKARGDLLGADTAGFVRAMGSLLAPPDRAACDGPIGSYFAGSMAEALAPGVDGWYADDVAFVRPWGFPLDRIQVPTSVWHGTDDGFVPVAHARWVAAHVPGATLRLFEGHGHLSLFGAPMGEVHAWIADRFRRP